jgi:hypothetical protein
MQAPYRGHQITLRLTTLDWLPLKLSGPGDTSAQATIGYRGRPIALAFRAVIILNLLSLYR